MYGKIDSQITFPDTPAGWADKEWLNFTLRIDTNAPWLKLSQGAHRQLRDRRRLPLADGAGYTCSTVEPCASENTECLALHPAIYSFPFELQVANQFIALRKPKRESL